MKVKAGETQGDWLLLSARLTMCPGGSVRTIKQAVAVGFCSLAACTQINFTLIDLIKTHQSGRGLAPTTNKDVSAQRGHSNCPKQRSCRMGTRVGRTLDPVP